MAHWIVPLETTEPEMFDFLCWLDEEWEYVAKKFGGTASSHWDEQLAVGLVVGTAGIDEWRRQCNQYLDRARTFGLNDIRGRQAVAKFAATAVAFAAAVVRVNGELPRGGTPSGTATPR